MPHTVIGSVKGGAGGTTSVFVSSLDPAAVKEDSEKTVGERDSSEGWPDALEHVLSSTLVDLSSMSANGEERKWYVDSDFVFSRLYFAVGLRSDVVSASLILMGGMVSRRYGSRRVQNFTVRGMSCKA